MLATGEQATESVHIEQSEKAANQDDSVQLEGGGSLKGTLSVSGSPFQYANDDYNYSSWEDIPAMILKVYTMNPYLADIVRSQVMKWEFNYNKE